MRTNLGSLRWLASTLYDAGGLAEHLLQARLAGAAGNAGTAEQQVAAIRAAADIIGALPPQHWPAHADRVQTALAAAPGSVHMAIYDAGHAWTLNPLGQADVRLPGAAREPAQPAARARIDRHEPPQPERWTELAAAVDPRLSTGAEWPRLAAALDRAAAASYDVPANLPRLAAEEPLPQHRPAAELYWRLLDDCPAAAAPQVSRYIAATAHVPEHVRRPPGPPSSVNADRRGPESPYR